MKALIGGGGLIFRFVVSGITAVLVVSVMSLAIGYLAKSPGPGSGTSGLTGSFLSSGPHVTGIYIVTEILVGIITFLGSYFMMSKSK